VSLLHLSNELIQCISEYLDSEQDISAFSRTSLRLHYLLNSYLYRHNVELFRGSALLWASEHGEEAAAQKSLREGANSQVTTNEGWTPLLLAATKGHGQVVELFLAQDGIYPDSDGRLYDGRTPLSRAAENGHETVTKLLLARADIDPDWADRFGRTPLYRAAQNGYNTVAELLLAMDGARPDCEDKFGQTPLSMASANGYRAVAELLLTNGGVNRDAKNSNGRTPLSWAAGTGERR
jgi:ankyrin repeat protein